VDRPVDANRDLKLALALAEVADELALRRFGARDLLIERKTDGSPVTDADRSIEAMLRTRLQEARPQDAVIGEEGGATGDSDRIWYLDPIDGTGKYVAGDSEWYILISLAIDGHAVVGVASGPALGERWWAATGAGAFRDGSPVRVSDTATLAEATVTDDWHHTLARGVTGHPLAALASACHRVRPHQGHAHLVVAGGAADLALGVGGSAWDFAPTKIIVEEAGGRFTDVEGRDAFDSGDSLVSNARLHEQALAAVRRSGSPAR
jgi:histidinol-phosphatase